MVEYLYQLGADKCCGLALCMVILALVAVECATSDRRNVRSR